MRLTVDDMQRTEAANIIVRKLHRRQRRQEQIANTHHIVIPQHGHLFGNTNAVRQQGLINHKRHPVIAADHRIKNGFPPGKLRQNAGRDIAVMLIAIGHIAVGQTLRVNTGFMAGTIQPLTTPARGQMLGRQMQA